MVLFVEVLFYVGVWLLGAGLIWACWTGWAARTQQLSYAAAVMLLGFLLVLGTVGSSRRQVVESGPRMEVVDGEKHITLTDWNGASYALLQAHPETTVLQIDNSDVTDQTLDHLREMTNLRELDLNDSQITDAGLAKLARLSGLETLRLRGTKITDHGLLEFLGPLPQLKRVDLRQTSVSSAAVQTWLTMLPGRVAMIEQDLRQR